MTLPNDYSRCHGTEAYVCQSCERRRQIGRDSPGAWYPYMLPAEVGGRCNYRIGSMSTHNVCGCTNEDCRINGCLMKLAAYTPLTRQIAAVTQG